MKRPLVRAGAAAGLVLVSLLLVGCPAREAAVSDPTGCVFTADAEVAGFIDFRAMNQSEFQRNLSKLPVLEELAKANPGGNPTEALGLTEEDFLSAAFSLSGIEGVMKEDPKGFKLSIALSTAKPVTTAKVRDLIATLSEGESEQYVKVESIADNSFLVYQESPREPEILITSLKNADGSLIVAGTRNAIQDTIARYQDNDNETPDEILNALDYALSDRQAWFVFTLPKALQDFIEKEAGGSGGGGMNPAAGFVQQVKNMRSFVLSMNVEDTMDMQFGIAFTEEEKATEFSAFLNGMLDNMIRPFMANQPDIPQAVKEMRFEADGGFAAVTFSFNEKETEVFLEKMASQISLTP